MVRLKSVGGLFILLLLSASLAFTFSPIVSSQLPTGKGDAPVTQTANFLLDLSRWDSIFRMRDLSSANAMVSTVAKDSDGLEWNITCNGVAIKAAMTGLDHRSFTIDTGNLAFYYQPPLDQQLNVSEYDFVNATRAIKDGQVMVERPENVVGSYAVYSTTKRDNEYQTGKICHIYRPLLVDSLGQTSWGWLNITSRTFTIGWNSSWIAGCTFPLTIDPAFGFTTIGASQTGLTNTITGTVYTMDAVNGVALNITAAIKKFDSGGNVVVGYAVYLNSTRALQANTANNTLTLTTSFVYRSLALASYPSLSASTNYTLVAWSSTTFCNMAYDEAAGSAGYRYATQSLTFSNWPTTATFTYGDQKRYSIFCNYSTIPTYTLPATPYNTTIAGAAANFSCQWSDTTGLSMATFETNNTGANVNATLALSGTGPSWANFTVTLNTTVGVKVSYTWYCNNTNNVFNTTTVAYVTTTGGAVPTIGDFTVSSGATVYAYQNVNVSITLQDLDGAYDGSLGLKNCTVSFDQSGIDLLWNASGNATSKVDANNRCTLISNWTTTVNNTAVTVTWSVTFYWNATEAVYGLDSGTNVFDQYGNNGTTTTGSFTFEDDLIVKASPTFNETRTDPSSSVLLSGQLYYQGTTTAPYNTTGIVATCELNSASKGTNSSIASDGTFQITITSEATPLGTCTYNVYSMTDQASTTNQTASFILERIMIYAKDDPLIQTAAAKASPEPTSVTRVSSLETLLLVPVVLGLALVLMLHRKLRRPMITAMLILLISTCMLVILSVSPTVNGSTQTLYIRNNGGPNHGQPNNNDEGQPWSPNNDIGTLITTAPTSSEQRQCSAWVQFYIDDMPQIENWSITAIYYSVHWILATGYNLHIGYQANGTYSIDVDNETTIGVGNSDLQWTTGTWYTNIAPPKIADGYYFLLKFYGEESSNPGGNLVVDTESGGPSYYSYITVTYSPKPEPSLINVTTKAVLANCTFYTFWTAEAGLSKFMFGCNNTGGSTMTNESSWTAFAGSPTTGWSNISKILNFTVGATVKWQFWVNDTANNFNTTGQQSFDITGKAVSVPVDTYVVIWFMARYETDGSAYTTGTLLVNGTAADYNSTNNYWSVNVTQSTPGNYTYSVSAVADSVYGLTALNDSVGGVTVEWTSAGFSATLTVNTPAHSWSLSPGQNNVTITEGTISLTITANANFNVQAKAGGNLVNGSYSIAIGNVLMSQSDIALAINMTTEYQNIPGLTNQASGTSLSKTFVLWLSCPTGKLALTYTYTLTIQVVQA